MKAERKPDILVIDDEPQLRRLLRFTLEDAGYAVREAESGRTGMGEVALCGPDLVILDLNLPDHPGMDILPSLRALTSVPLLVLSVFGQEGSKVAALDAGADDYLTKPYGGSELIARIRALLRRVKPAPAESAFRFGTIEVDLANRRVLRDGLPVKLTATEHALLQLMIFNRGKVLTHRRILRDLWGDQYQDHIQYLRTYMMRLRRKLGDDGVSGGYFQTEAGIGYRFMPDGPPP